MSSPPAKPRDLAVDLDGTLIATDSLHEGFVKALFSAPGVALKSAAMVFAGPAAVKRTLAPASAAGAAHYPVRQEFLEWLRAERAQGRRLHLVTAADREVADSVAAAFPIFDSVLASEDGRNLKGKAKREALQDAFPDGFAYAGDSAADLAVFAKAGSAVLVSSDAGVRRRLKRLGVPLEREFSAKRGGAATWLKAIRIHQWAKNLLMFMPLLLAGQQYNVPLLLQTLIGFLLCGLAASGGYIVNDLADLESDRRHATKRSRPFASGALPITSGLAAAALLIGGSLAAAAALNAEFAIMLAVYVALTLTYTFTLKKVAMLDVTALAALYGLRLGMGAAIGALTLSAWLLVFAGFLFFSLSLAKRSVEIVNKAKTFKGKIPGRGYYTDDLPVVMGFGIAATACAVLVLALFIEFGLFMKPIYSEPRLLWVAPVAVAMWTLRIWLLAARGTLNDDPVAFAVRDPVSIGLGAVAGGAVLAAMAL